MVTVSALPSVPGTRKLSIRALRCTLTSSLLGATSVSAATHSLPMSNVLFILDPWTDSRLLICLQKFGNVWHLPGQMLGNADALVDVAQGVHMETTQFVLVIFLSPAPSL